MPDAAQSGEKLNREAVGVFHALPLMVLALGLLVAGVYVLVGDSIYLLVGAFVALVVFQAVTVRHAQRHSVMQTCPRCENLHGNGIVTRFFVWYCHRRIWDNKVVLLIGAAGIIVSVIYDAVGKPYALLPFMAAYGLFMVQFAMFLRSVAVHRGNESSCQLCAAGDDTHPYRRVTASDLKD
jgi:hypothetical protein